MADTSKFRQGINEFGMKDSYARKQLEKKIPIPPTAEVGQVITVTEVDENGYPINWEARTPPSPSFKLVGDVTTTEEVAYVSLEIPDDITQICAFVKIPDTSVSASLYVTAWRKAGAINGCAGDSMCGNLNQVRYITAHHTLYGDLTNADLVTFGPYNLNKSTQAGTPAEATGKYFTLSTQYGGKVFPVGVNICLFGR